MASTLHLRELLLTSATLGAVALTALDPVQGAGLTIPTAPTPAAAARAALLSEATANRAGFIAALVARWAEDGTRAEQALRTRLEGLPLERLLAAAAAEDRASFEAAAGVGPYTGVRTQSVATAAGLSTPAAVPDLDTTPVEFKGLSTPCRVWDSRKYNQDPADSEPVPGARAASITVSNWFGDIPPQGGDPAGCPEIPDHPAAVVLTLSAVSPTLPNSYPGAGFGTVFPYPDPYYTYGWTYAGEAPYPWVDYYSYDTPPFNKSTSVLWDKNTGLIANTLIIPVCRGCSWHLMTYSSGTSHYIADVIGYFEEVQSCPDPVNQILLNGACFEAALRPADSWVYAQQDCASAGGRLPHFTEVFYVFDYLEEWTGDIDDAGSILGAWTGAGGLEDVTSGVPYRCVFDALD